MLSILIPNFNYNAYPIAYQLYQQANKLGIKYELLVYDDDSSLLFKENLRINTLKNCLFKSFSKNVGIEANRQRLSIDSIYENLLFLDSDTKAKPNYLNTYFKFLPLTKDAIFGGVSYSDETPEKHKRLRWKYGKRFEDKSASVRQKKHYLNIVSSNFCINRNFFLNINKDITYKQYGNDIMFSGILRNKNSSIIHIDNAIIHLGLDTNAEFLEKTEKALHSYVKLYREFKINKNDNNLIKLVELLSFLRLRKILSFFYKVIGHELKTKLTNNSPHIFIFQLYRLLYMSYIFKTN